MNKTQTICTLLLTIVVAIIGIVACATDDYIVGIPCVVIACVGALVFGYWQGGIGMICKECGSKMYLDDRDTNFKGNYDNYWNCEKCQTSCIEQVRFAQSFKEIWHSENNDEVKDYEIKHQIKRM